MAQKTYTIADFSQSSSWNVAYNGSTYYISSNPTLASAAKSITPSGIPAGSTIDSAYIEATLGSPDSGINLADTSFGLNGASYTTPSTWDDTTNPWTEPIPTACIDRTGWLSIVFRFRANGSTSGGSGTKYSTLTYSNITVYVNYTPPTAASVSGVSTASTHLPPSTNTTLSWTAADGTLNAITSFTINYRDNGGAFVNLVSGLSPATRSYTVPSPAVGVYREFSVYAYAPYGDVYAISGALYSYSAPSVSSLLLDYSGSNQYRGAGAGLILSWSAANGSYNAITGYQVLRNDNDSGWYEISVANGGVVAAPGAGQTSTFAVLAYGTYSNSGYTNSPILYSYSAVSAPTGVSISTSACKPGNSVTLSWNASSAGVGVSVTGYHIYENGVYKAAVSGVSYTFSAPSVGSYSYIVYAIGSVSGYNSGASSGVSLTVEDPKSTVALNKTTVAMDGSTTITATLTVSNATFTHTVRWYLDGSYTQTNNLSAGDSSDTFAPPLNWNNKYPSSTNGTATCLVTTYNGGVSVGTDSKTFSVIVPDSVVPTISTGVSQLSGFGSYYLKSITGCRVTPTHGGAYGSTIVSWYAYGGGYSSSVLGVETGYWDTGALTVVGTNNMTVVVTDSRGRTATHTNSTVSVTDYAPPLIYAYTAKRCDSNGTLLDTGTYIKVTASVAETSLTGNSITAFTVKYRQYGGSYGSASNLTEGVGLVVGAGGINEAYAYDVAVTATDSVGKSSTVVMQISPSQYLFDFKKDRAGIGRLSDPSAAKTFLLPEDWKTNIVSTRISNPNLLHNWDFRETPVNQRAASGDITSGYFYDRWMRYAGTITIAATYLSMPADASIEQRIEGHGLSGKAVTISVMLGGTVISGSGTFPTSAGTVAVTLTGFGTATLGYHADYMFVRITAADSTRQLQAVKLELGTVSTLAYDPPMDYGIESIKCYRYAKKLLVDAGRLTSYTAGNLYFKIQSDVPMRIVSPSIIGTFDVYTVGQVLQSGFTFSVNYANMAGVHIFAAKAAHGMTDAMLWAGASGVIISADL